MADFWADVMRWWSWGGASLAIGPAGRTLARVAALWLRERRRAIAVPLVVALCACAALASFLVFALAAGFVIPLIGRLPGFGMDDPVFAAIMAFAWTCVATGCWAGALAFRRARWLIALAALFWLLAVTFALSATA